MAKTPTRNILFKFLGDQKSLEQATRATTGNLGKVEKSSAGANKSMGVLKGGAIALGGVLAAGALFQGLKSAVLRAQEMDSQYAITEQVIKKTGGAANLTGEQVKAMSKEMAMTTGIDKVVATEAANILLTFKGLRNEVGMGNDVFSRAHALTADLAAVMGGSATAQAITLGKALNAPVEGLTALRRVGVTFTEEQKKVIKSLVATGDVLGAQKILLEELESQVGGTAVASADATAIIGNAWDEVLELVGKELLPILAEIAPKIVTMVENIEPALKLLSTLFGEVQGAGAEMSAEFADAGDESVLTAERISELSGKVDALFDSIGPIPEGLQAINRFMGGTSEAAEDAEVAIFDMAGGLGDLEWQTARTTDEVEDLVDETVNLADEMRKLVDPVFKAQKAQEAFDKVLRQVTEDGIVTRAELDKLTKANLDLAAANEKVTPENMEAYAAAVEETRRSVVGDAKLMEDALAGIGAKQSLEAFLGLVQRLETLAESPIEIDLSGLNIASRADVEQAVTRLLLSMQRRGDLVHIPI